MYTNQRGDLHGLLLVHDAHEPTTGAMNQAIFGAHRQKGCHAAYTKPDAYPTLFSWPANPRVIGRSLLILQPPRRTALHYPMVLTSSHLPF